MAKTFKELTKRQQAGTLIASVFAVLAIGGIANGMSSPTTQQVAPQNTVQAPVVTTKEVSETEAIPFSKTSHENPLQNQGTSVISTAGVHGTKTKTYSVTYTDGIETGRTLKSEVVTTQPIAEDTSIGTYVAPAVTESSGATAKCRDGSLSYSAHRSGTCSHHGGVAIWY